MIRPCPALSDFRKSAGTRLFSRARFPPPRFRFREWTNDSIGRSGVVSKSPSSPYGRSRSPNDVDVAVTMHRLIENDVPRCVGTRVKARTRAECRGPCWKDEGLRIKRAYLSMKRHIGQIEFDAMLILPFSPRIATSFCLIFDQLWKLNVHPPPERS